jgi:hypothetical protein
MVSGLVLASLLEGSGSVATVAMTTPSTVICKA